MQEIHGLILLQYNSEATIDYYITDIVIVINGLYHCGWAWGASE